MKKLFLTAGQALALLNQAGVKDVEIVDDEAKSTIALSSAEAAPVTVDTLLGSIDTSRKAILEPQILAAHKDSVNGEMTRRFNDAFKNKLHTKTGIPLADLKDITDTDEMLAKSLEYNNGIVGKGKEDLVAQLDAMMKKHQDSISKINDENGKTVNELKEKLTSKEIIALLAKDHNEATGLPKDSNRAMLASDYYAWLKSQAIVKYNEESNAIELYDPKKPDVRLYNDSNTSFVKPSDLMPKRYGKDGLNILSNDTRSTNPVNEMAAAAKTTYAKGADGKLLSPIEQQIAAAAAWADGAAA